MFLDKILLPVDFSDRSFGATRFVEALADPEKTQIYVLHVTTPLSYELAAVDVGGSVLSGMQADRAIDEKTQLEGFLDEELRPYKVERVLLEGDPAHRIVEFAHQNRVDLIAMPTHGYGLFRRFLLGSVTAKVLHDADCPVWTGVHMEEAPEASRIRFRKIVAAIDLCPAPSLRTLEWAGAMAERFGSKLVIAHAFPSLEGRVGEYFDVNWRDYFADLAVKEIRKLEEKAGVEAAEVVVEPGDAARMVSGLAEREQVDALVIGRGSASGTFGRLRANAYAIIRQAPCPVVSV